MSILLPFAISWARSVGFSKVAAGWQRGSEIITTDELIKRYQLSLK
jgi:hypothetical protein